MPATNENTDKIKTLKETCNEMYLDYFNNFGTLQGFADHYRISKSSASRIIDLGREYNYDK